MQSDACTFITYLATEISNDRNKTLNCFGSSQQVCLPVSANRNESANVYEVTEALRTHSGGNVASCFSDRLKWTLTKFWHGVFYFILFVFVFLSGFLSASLSAHSCECNTVLQLSPLHGQNLNPAANQNQILRMLFSS